MNRGKKASIVFLIAALGLWGCARPNGHTALAERLKQMEAKCGKLEEDYRAVASARDQARKRVVVLEEERARLLKELEVAKVVAKERDDLKATSEVRTSERDALQVRCDRLKKGLQSLLGQDDALAPTVPAAAPMTTAPSVAPTPNS